MGLAALALTGRIRRIATADHDRRAMIEEALRDAAADAARTAGDEHDLAVEIENIHRDA